MTNYTETIRVYHHVPPMSVDVLNDAINNEAHPDHAAAKAFFMHAFNDSYDPTQTYELVYSYDTTRYDDDADMALLNVAWEEFNVDDPGSLGQAYRARRLRSLSVGDIVEVNGRAWMCDRFGWSILPNFDPTLTNPTKEHA